MHSCIDAATIPCNISSLKCDC